MNEKTLGQVAYEKYQIKLKKNMISAVRPGMTYQINRSNVGKTLYV